MFSFPYLTSLVSKNDQYRSLFQRTCEWERRNKHEVEQKPQNDKKGETRRLELSSDQQQEKSQDEQNGKFVLHWKKAVKLKFEGEGENEALSEDQDPTINEEGISWLKNWNLESILRQKPVISGNATGSSTSCDLQCSICDDEFDSRRQLNQHKRLEHFPSWEGGNKEFCYVPYFVEPKRFNLLRGTLASGQSECALCQKWLGGRVREKIGPYLENLRLKLKNEAVEVSEVAANAAADDNVILNKGRIKSGRKCKSMSRRVCELCSKILSNRKGLERHMLIHTGEKPFPCDICGKPFRRKDNCVRHKKTAHLFKKPRKPRRRKTISSTNASTTTNAIESNQVSTIVN